MRAAAIAIALGAVLATPAAAAAQAPQIIRFDGGAYDRAAAIATDGGGLRRNTAYSYRVRAFNAGGVSAYSNTATAKTRHN